MYIFQESTVNCNIDENINSNHLKELIFFVIRREVLEKYFHVKHTTTYTIKNISRHFQYKLCLPTTLVNLRISVYVYSPSFLMVYSDI